MFAGWFCAALHCCGTNRASAYHCLPTDARLAANATAKLLITALPFLPLSAALLFLYAALQAGKKKGAGAPLTQDYDTECVRNLGDVVETGREERGMFPKFVEYLSHIHLRESRMKMFGEGGAI